MHDRITAKLKNLFSLTVYVTGRGAFKSKFKHFQYAQTLSHTRGIHFTLHISVKKQYAWNAAWVWKKGVRLVLFSLGIQV